MKRMRIILKKDGTQEIEVLGAKGDECLAFSAELEKRLGKGDGERELKPEFHESADEGDSETEQEYDV